MEAVHLKNHLYDDVYSYRGHEIWVSSEPNNLKEGKKRFYYYVDGNQAVTKKQLLPWYPKFQTMEEAIKHGQKRIENMNLESVLLKKLS